MDLLSQHEAFLRAIFDAPEDDTPRLVYADFLQEQGEEERAEFIRVQCELALSHDAERQAVLKKREKELIDVVIPWHEPAFMHGCKASRGFWHEEVHGGLLIAASDLSVPNAFRWRVVKVFPSWFGEQRLEFERDQPLNAEQIEAVFALPFANQVTAWDASGHVSEEMSHSGPGAFDLVELVQRPAITTRGVESLARQRGARRITELDLRNNNLDNDAARALVASPYLDNLKRLQLLEGNRFRGRVWQQVIERFGEDVVG